MTQEEGMVTITVTKRDAERLINGCIGEAQSYANAEQRYIEEQKERMAAGCHDCYDEYERLVGVVVAAIDNANE